MRFPSFLLLPLALVPTLAIAADDGGTQCTYGDMVRRVVIMSEPGVSVPCEVHYYKDTEAPGEKQVLWSAGSQEGFCESRTEEFIAKLEGWGWDCGQGADAMPAAEPEADPMSEVDAAEEAEEAEEAPPVYDDTDVLSPGNPTD